MLDKVALMLDELNIAVYDPTVPANNQIYFGAVPSEKTNVWGIRPGVGPIKNLGVNRSMSSTPSSVQLYYKGDVDFYPSYETVKAAFDLIHCYDNTDFSFVVCSNDEPLHLGVNEANINEFTINIVCYVLKPRNQTFSMLDLTWEENDIRWNNN